MLTRISIILTLLPMFLAANPLHVSAKGELTVMLDWFVNPDHGPLIIAHEKGFFSKMSPLPLILCNFYFPNHNNYQV